ncbi:hypothetical protein F4604DRAFT_1939909 [Suillus subluteus]|nr:hypothetical protein F4604DRAFT_1939909 [Suillus subluteus]
MEAEREWSTPPDNLEVVERSSTPFVPTDPAISEAEIKQIDADHLLALALSVAPPSPPPSEPDDTLIASQSKLALVRGYSPSDDLYVADPDYVPTSLIDRIDLDTPTIMPTPLPVPPPQSRLPSPMIPLTRTRPSKGKRRVRATALLSYGLPLSKVHNKQKSWDDTTNSLQVDTTESIRFAQMEASQNTQELHSNYVCNTCHKLGHKMRHCNRYFCRICGQFAPGHYTSTCRNLNGKKLLRRGLSDPNFFAQLRKLEAAYDQAAAVEDQQHELNALEAEEWLADVDVLETGTSQEPLSKFRLRTRTVRNRYKDLEAAQAAGKNIKFLPPPAPAPNASLLRNGKSDRDRNRMVAPVVISEAFADAGHALKTSNSRWMTMLDVLYSTRLCIHDWPAGVPPPGPDFDLKSLSVSQLRALVGPYLRIHLGDTYEAELGRDEDEDDSDAEKAKMAKRKGKSKKSDEHRRTKGAVVEVPDVLLSIQDWSPHVQDLISYTGEVYTIPLVIDTDGVILRRLKDSEKFIKDLPPHVTRKQIGKTIRDEYPTSDASAEHSFPEDSHPNLRTNSRAHSYQQVSRPRVTAPCANSGAPHSNLGAMRPPNSGAMRANQGASRSIAGASRSIAGASRSAAGASRPNQLVARHTDYDDLTDYNDLPADYDSLPPSSPFSPATPRGSNVAHGRSQYNRLREDIRHSFAPKPDIRKRPRGDYETISEADNIETDMVDDRRRARTHDRTSMDQRSTVGHQRKPIARAPSMAHSGAVPNNNTARVASCSSVVPYADRSPSRHHGR